MNLVKWIPLVAICLLLATALQASAVTEPVYTRITDVEFEFLHPSTHDGFEFVILYGIETWNQRNTSVTLEPCMVNLTISFTAFQNNQTICTNDEQVTLEPGLTKWWSDIITIKQPSSIREIFQTDVQINFTTTDPTKVGYLFNATLHDLVFGNLTERYSYADQKSTTYDPTPDTWGQILDDPNMPPIHFRAKDSIATAEYLEYYPQINGTLKGELINLDSSPSSLWIPTSKFGDIHISAKGTTFEVLYPYPETLMVQQVEIDPGVHNLSRTFTANILNYSEKIEQNATLYFKYVINGYSPQHPNFIPLIVHIQDGVITKTVLPRPEITTTGNDANFAWTALMILAIPRKRK